jgi:long-chain acyl-CoA synthetase
MNKTGYPAIDKPWMKYYDEKKVNSNFPKENIFDYVKEKNKNREEEIAMSYYGNQINYAQMYENIDKATKLLHEYGVENNNRIMSLLPNIPETAYLFYAASQLGAISDYIDPRPDSLDSLISAKKALSLFIEEKAKHLIVLDQCYLSMIKPIANELKDYGVEDIIIVSPTDSMKFTSKCNYIKENIDFNGFNNFRKKILVSKAFAEQLKEAKKHSPLKIYNYSDLLSQCNYTTYAPIKYEQNKMVAIVHTSGTSSPKPKPIPLTNDNFNSYAYQTTMANMPMERGDDVLHILPYFSSFGIVDVMHTGFCYGDNLIQIPEFSPANFGSLLLKYQPQVVIGTPSWFLGMIEDKKLINKDLSFLTMATYGGESMEPEDEEKVNNFLKNHNCKCKLTKGHGMTETCGCASYSINEYGQYGSMGIPMPNTIYSVVDPITKDPQKFTEDKDYIEGEFAISSSMLTPGILDDKIIVPHHEIQGQDYIFTKDIGRMTKDGLLYFLSRTDRAFMRFDGFKIKPYEIENIIKSNSLVKYCVITPYLDNDVKGYKALASIVLEDSKELNDDEKVDVVKTILNNSFIKNENVSTRQYPAKVRIVSELPLNPNGKVDYNKIVSEGLLGDEINIELEETNVSLGMIKVYKNKNLTRSKKLK